MKKKKLWVRIGAVLACVLLVGSLAIPAFAYDGVYQNIEVLYNDFYGSYLPSVSKTSAYDLFIGALENFAGSRTVMLDHFFQYDSLASGDVVLSDRRLYFTDGESYLYFMDPNLDGCIYINGEYYAFAGETVSAQVGSLTIIDFPSIEIIGGFNSDGLFKILSVIRRDTDETYPVADITSMSIVLARRGSVGQGIDTNPTLEVLSALLLDTDKCITHPDAYAYGWHQTYTTDQYQQGYDDAVADIDSGDFGKNFLGGILRAPFQALNEFTLIQWTTEAGATISVSLGNIISAGIGIALFIWFLKLFAGG